MRHFHYYATYSNKTVNIVSKNIQIKFLDNYIRSNKRIHLPAMSTKLVWQKTTLPGEIFEIGNIHPASLMAIIAVPSIQKRIRKKVVVPITNMLPYPITLPKGAFLCTFNNIKVESCNTINQIINTEINNNNNNNNNNYSSNSQDNEAIWNNIKDKININKKIPKAIQQQMTEIVRKHLHLFANDRKDHGNLKDYQMRIDTQDHLPIKKVPYRYSPKQKQIIEKEITHLLECDLVQAANSPWGFPVVLVVKFDGSWRFCVDYRELNSITVKDSYPLPQIVDTIDSLGGSQVFSTLDLMAGYWQVRLTEDAKKKTTFVTHLGAYCFNVMPFGLTNAPAAFQRCMDTILGL